MDADPIASGVQIQGLPALETVLFNEADNVNGTILYSAFTLLPPSEDFDIALVTFRARD